MRNRLLKLSWVVVLCLLIVGVENHFVFAQSPDVSSPAQVKVEAVVDPRWGYELWVSWSKEGWLIRNQNRVSFDGKSAFTVLTAGKEFAVTRDLNITCVAGPQLTMRLNGVEVMRVDRVVLFVNAQYKRGDLMIVSLNRLSWGLEDTARFMNRHVQVVHLPGTPLAVSLRFEELRTAERLTEAFCGLQVKVGKRASVYGYYDVVSYQPRIRLSYVW